MTYNSFKAFPGELTAAGATTVTIQQPNASVEWDIYQISVIGTLTISPNMICAVYLNGFLVCNSNHAVLDTAQGPPDVILGRSDTLTVVFTGGGPNDQVSVALWYNENPAGTTSAAPLTGI